MAKEFKQFDTMFSGAEIKAMRDKYLGNVGQQDLDMFDKWHHTISVGGWANEYIRFCVYLSSTSLYWQQFRVALKGLTTKEKLFMLNKYGEMHFVDNQVWHDRKIEKCRIDNYIGALVRSGQLSVGTYEVLK